MNQRLKRLPALRLKRMASGSSLGTRARCPYSQEAQFHLFVPPVRLRRHRLPCVPVARCEDQPPLRVAGVRGRERRAHHHRVLVGTQHPHADRAAPPLIALPNTIV